MFSRVLKFPSRAVLALLVALSGPTLVGLTSQAAAKPAFFTFDLVKNTAVATCLPNARGVARITTRGQNQQLDVFVSGLPAHNTFTVFVLQLPHGPFGMAWYQGDVITDAYGVGHASFHGIFSDETFVMAPGVGAAPVVDPKDASTNPQTAPVHMFHLGLWFDSVNEAEAASCPVGQTPFNGDHTAGIQVLNTTDFPDGDGPIGQFGR